MKIEMGDAINLQNNCIRFVSIQRMLEICTAIFKKVATFKIDFASRDIKWTHKNAFRSCDSNFTCQTVETEWIKNFDSQIKCTLLHSKKSFAALWFHQFEVLFSCKKIVCLSFDWRHQSPDLNAVPHDLNAIFERVTWSKCNVDVATFMKTAVQPFIHTNTTLCCCQNRVMWLTFVLGCQRWPSKEHEQHLLSKKMQHV